MVCLKVEIKRAEPRDGSGKLGSGGGGMGGGGMGVAPGDAPAGSQWGPPQAPMNIIQSHNGQMGGPPINMPMAGPNIMQGLDFLLSMGCSSKRLSELSTTTVTLIFTKPITHIKGLSG